jgi:hypothetical protein
MVGGKYLVEWKRWGIIVGIHCDDTHGEDKDDNRMKYMEEWRLLLFSENKFACCCFLEAEVSFERCDCLFVCR